MKKNIVVTMIVVGVMSSILNADNVIVVDQHGCKLINPVPGGNESITWTGSCKDGLLNGYGILTWFKDGVKGKSEETGVVNGNLLTTNHVHDLLRCYFDDSSCKFIESYNRKGLTKSDNKYYVDGFLLWEWNKNSGHIFYDGTIVSRTLFEEKIATKGDNYLAYEKEKERYYKNKEEAYRSKREADAIKFRKNLQEGDETSNGLVVQVKGNLVKIQTNDSQCSQRDYDGNCKNWINTPVEKWIKRSEIYPK